MVRENGASVVTGLNPGTRIQECFPHMKTLGVVFPAPQTGHDYRYAGTAHVPPWSIVEADQS